MRLDRLLAITLMLLNRDRISAGALAEHFEVSVRTIYRDIEAINLAGIPIISYAGHEGGFGIMEHYRIDRQLFSLKDMLAMLTALKGLNLTLRDKDLDLTIEKITSLVPREKKEQLARHYEQLVIDIMPWGQGEKQKKKEEWVSLQKDGSALVRMSLPEGEWVYGMLLSYGENVKVLKPAYIRKIIQERAQKILRHYMKTVADRVK